MVWLVYGSPLVINKATGTKYDNQIEKAALRVPPFLILRLMEN
jgi:hypothetical protein